MRPAQLLTILDREFTSTTEGHHTPVMLWGPPGVGKSQIVAQIAQKHGVPVIDIRLSQMEPSDLRGIPFRAGETVEWAVPGILPNAERHGPTGILFLDEITSAPPAYPPPPTSSSWTASWGNMKCPKAGRSLPQATARATAV